MRSVALWGLGVTGRAVADAAIRRGLDVRAWDENITSELTRWASERGLDVRDPDGDPTAALADVDALVPAPGLGDTHPAVVQARAIGVDVMSEFDLAQMWDDRPIVAVTGTDGKTTVVTLIEHMLTAAGRRTVAVGNTDVPLISAIDNPDYELFVVEASSFRLSHSRCFRPNVAAWINFGPDHLDAHGTLEQYEAAKASIWKHLSGDSIAVANRDDALVARHAARIEHGVVHTFGQSPNPSTGAAIIDGALTMHGEFLTHVADLPRRLPHDLANAQAAALCAHAAGADGASIAAALGRFVGLPHRAETVAIADGVTWVNDSKATTPHAAASALAAFESVILIAGGRNKDLSFAPLAEHARSIRHVVAIGESAPDIVAAFDGLCECTSAESMPEAVQVAAAYARSGDAVLLSPACASFDWYANYRQRGDDFTQLARQITQNTSVTKGTLL